MDSLRDVRKGIEEFRRGHGVAPRAVLVCPKTFFALIMKLRAGTEGELSVDGVPVMVDPRAEEPLRCLPPASRLGFLSGIP